MANVTPRAWASGYRRGAIEQATTPRPLTLGGSSRPPRSRVPGVLQGVRLTRDPIGFYTRLRKRHGDIFAVRFFYFGDIVIVTDPALVKQVFSGSPTTFHAGAANATVLEPALGPNSVLTLDEDAHMAQRKLLLPPFHGQSIQRYGELIREIAEQQISTWSLGETFALRPHTQAITLAVILRAVYGVSDEERFERAAALVDEFARRADLITQIPPLRRNLGRRSPWARFLRAREALDELIYEEIELRRSEAADGEERDDVLSLLLQARHDDGTPMSDRELRDELVTVVGAGHETTATALAWAFERLLRTPRVLAKLRESLAAGETDYLDAVIKETLRSRPVILDVARMLASPAEIGGYELPAGTMVMPTIAGIHHREDLYPNPEEFRPERFLDDGGRDHFAWIPFGGGVRRCIGAAFAEYEMRIIIRTILEHVELEAPDPRPERVRTRNITVAPAKGARVRVVRRLQPAG